MVHVLDVLRSVRNASLESVLYVKKVTTLVTMAHVCLIANFLVDNVKTISQQFVLVVTISGILLITIVP